MVRCLERFREHVQHDLALTEREALARADRTKAFAKQAGKDCTAGYDHELMREGDLRIRAR